VAIDGRLEWREWQDKETGKNRQSIDIIADSVQFLGSRDDNGGGGGYGGGGGQSFQGSSDIPVDTGDFAPPATAPVGGGASTGDDDIPF
jgi:single-strand DNA-binding protein